MLETDKVCNRHVYLQVITPINLNQQYLCAQVIICKKYKAYNRKTAVSSEEKDKTRRSNLSFQTSKLILLLYFILGTSFAVMILLYRIVLFADILLTWATLQQPYISKTLSAPLSQNKNDWVHSVLFEPQPTML